jgi:guanosine-3',5'-bis(diphosphate) 3'-pyrophosphohydrolase
MSSPWSQESYLKAYWFATQAHTGQRYPGTDLPYSMHFSFVAMEIIAALSAEPCLDGDLAVQCALLHDTLEDTSVTHEHLADTFGPAVADGVQALTKDISVGADLDEKDVGKRLQMKDSLERIQKQPREIWMVKMADRITNLQPPPASWSDEKIENYRREADLILKTLKNASKFLSNRLEEKIAGYSK